MAFSAPDAAAPRMLAQSTYPDAPAYHHKLYEASLVVREWPAPSQHLLLVHARLQTRKHASAFSQAFLAAPESSSSHALGAYVHTLEVSTCADPTRDDSDGKSSVKRRATSKKDITWTDLAVLLACCPYLVDLRIKNIQAHTAAAADQLVVPPSVSSLTLTGEASTDVANLISRHAQRLTTLVLDLLPPSTASFDDASAASFELAQSVFGAAGRLRTLALRNAAWLAPVLPPNPACAGTLRTLAIDAWVPQLASLVSSGALPHLETFALSGCRGGFELPASKTLVSLLPETLKHLRLSVEPRALTLTGRDAVEAAAVEEVGLPATLESVTWEQNAFIAAPTALQTALHETCRAHNIQWHTQQIGAQEERIYELAARDLDTDASAAATLPPNPSVMQLSSSDVRPIVLPKRGAVGRMVSWVVKARRNFSKEMKPWEY